jgi:hypothetical protein
MTTSSLDELAEQLNRLTPQEREILYQKVRHKDFVARLERLSERYRARLAREGNLARTPEDLLAAWAEEREDLVRRDRPE